LGTPWDDVRSKSAEVPAVRVWRPSPLPWMLLTVSIALTVGVLALGRSRLEDERTRTANALKANDELKAKVKVAEAALEAAKTQATERDNELGERKKRVLTLELELRRLQDELARSKKK
jgi:peptidoglycan hydrolase CwlO-like protein